MGDNTIAVHCLVRGTAGWRLQHEMHPLISPCNRMGVVDSGKGSSRVVFIKEAGVGSGRRKFPGVGRKPLSDLWSLQLPGDS